MTYVLGTRSKQNISGVHQGLVSVVELTTQDGFPSNITWPVPPQ